MGIKIQTTNQPVNENGDAIGNDGRRAELAEVDEAEFIDLTRMGLIVKGKGDVQDDGTLKQKVAKEAAPQVLAVTGQQPTIQRTEG